MQKGVIFFCLLIFPLFSSSAEQISFENFSFDHLIKNYRSFNIKYNIKITSNEGEEYSFKAEINVSDKNSFYLRKENLVGGGFFNKKIIVE